jgi:transmembrane sensor
LSDGSYVRLAEGSVLRELEGEGPREVELEGRGFFAVSRDEARPFVVRTGSGDITVLGTRFQVTAEDEETAAIVVEGLVRVSNDAGSAEIPAGHQGTLRRGQEPSAQAAEDVYALLEWSDGILVFQATPLSLVAREVSRHYGRTLDVVGPDLPNRRVTAWFQGESFEAVAEALCMVTEASCLPAESGVVMGSESGGGSL